MGGFLAKKLAYQQDSLVSLVQARSEQMGLELVINDGVHYFHNLFIRQMTIKNNKNWSRRVRIFLTMIFPSAAIISGIPLF